MPSTLSSAAVDAITRGELRLLDELVDLSNIPARQRSDLLDLSEADWLAWRGFRHDGPRPVEPELPDMLLRLAVGAYAMAQVIEPESGVFDQPW